MTNPYTSRGRQAPFVRGYYNPYQVLFDGVAAGPVIPALPQLANLTQRFRLCDISMLWQDVAGTIPVVANLDPVARVDNIGTSGVPLLQPTAAQQPVWDAVEGTVRFDGNDALFAAVPGPMTTYAYAVLGWWRSSTATITMITNAWGLGNLVMSAEQRYQGAIPFTTKAPIAGTQFDRAAQPIVGERVSSVNSANTVGPVQTVLWNNGENDSQGNPHSNAPGGTSIVLGAQASNGGTGWDGWIKEFIVWDVPLIPDESDEVGVYDAVVNGVTWLPRQINYVASARDYDGATRNRRSGSVPTGVTDGRLGTFSAWIKPGIIGAAQGTLLMSVDQIGGGAIGQLIRFADAGGGYKLVLNLHIGSTQSGMTILMGGALSLNTWHHISASWNYVFPAVAGNISMYVDGVVQVDGVNGCNLSQGATDENLAYAAKGNSWTQGSKSLNFDTGDFGGPRFFNGCVSNLYFNIDERVDLTVQANREKFRTGAGKPVYLGATGQLPTGSQPAFYAENGELNTNEGYAEDLPVVLGTVTDCSDAPS